MSSVAKFRVASPVLKLDPFPFTCKIHKFFILYIQLISKNDK